MDDNRDDLALVEQRLRRMQADERERAERRMAEIERRVQVLERAVMSQQRIKIEVPSVEPS